MALVENLGAEPMVERAGFSEALSSNTAWEKACETGQATTASSF